MSLHERIHARFEYLIGLDQMTPLVCQPLFVAGELKEDVIPDADYLFSLLELHYSWEGTSRRCFEEDIMDFFQDILNDCETGNVVGHQAPIACKQMRTRLYMNQDQSLVFESPSLSVPGIMGWLTGSQHKPISGKRFKVPVYFDHDCLKNAPGHSVFSCC